MRRKKKLKQLEASFGVVPDESYYTEDIISIRSYYEHRKAHGLDPFFVDDTTWYDLSVDKVFKQINATQSTSGEQVLYAMLRTPVQEEEAYRDRKEMIAMVERDASLRLSLQYILSRLGKYRSTSAAEAFHPTNHKKTFFFLTAFLSLAFITCLIGLAFSQAFVVPLTILFFVNPVYYFIMSRYWESELMTVNYATGMISAARRMEQTLPSGDRTRFAACFDACKRLKTLGRIGGLSFAGANDIMMIINVMTLANLVSFEWLRRKLPRHREEIFVIHETIGMIDSAIAIASYRYGLGEYCQPEINFAKEASPLLAVEGMTHPLLTGSVANDIRLSGPLLVTGSNASGKSTFLKAAALNALLAQSICTATCHAYRATSFRVYTSMALTDNILAGDSYFITEIKSLKRIIDAASGEHRILCVIDEVLRGTNTVERVAASSELLASLRKPNVICIAATHDIELCTLLRDFRLAHFEERLDGGDIHFDFLLKEGPATTRNAIRLLALLGFDEELVDRASKRAERFMAQGNWSDAEA